MRARSEPTMHDITTFRKEMTPMASMMPSKEGWVFTRIVTTVEKRVCVTNPPPWCS